MSLLCPGIPGAAAATSASLSRSIPRSTAERALSCQCEHLSLCSSHVTIEANFSTPPLCSGASKWPWPGAAAGGYPSQLICIKWLCVTHSVRLPACTSYAIVATAFVMPRLILSLHRLGSCHFCASTALISLQQTCSVIRDPASAAAGVNCIGVSSTEGSTVTVTLHVCSGP